MVGERRDGEGAGADPSRGSGSQGKLPPWPADFPDVIVHTTLEQLYGAALSEGASLSAAGQSSSYAAAKAGDVLAAQRVILSIIRPRLILDFASNLPDAVVVGVHAQERAGRNALPEAYAKRSRRSAAWNLIERSCRRIGPGTRAQRRGSVWLAPPRLRGWLSRVGTISSPTT